MDENPYESPQVPSEKSPRHLPARRMALAIVLGILTLPAAGIAFFSTCLVTVMSLDGTAPNGVFEAGVGVGALAGLCVAGVMIFFTFRAARRRS